MIPPIDLPINPHIHPTTHTFTHPPMHVCVYALAHYDIIGIPQ